MRITKTIYTYFVISLLLVVIFILFYKYLMVNKELLILVRLLAFVIFLTISKTTKEIILQCNKSTINIIGIISIIIVAIITFLVLINIEKKIGPDPLATYLVLISIPGGFIIAKRSLSGNNTNKYKN